MATTIKLDGDAEKGWMGEVHHDGQFSTHSPPGGTFIEALLNMVHAHFGPPPADSAQVPAAPQEDQPPVG